MRRAPKPTPDNRRRLIVTEGDSEPMFRQAHSVNAYATVYAAPLGERAEQNHPGVRLRVAPDGAWRVESLPGGLFGSAHTVAAGVIGQPGETETVKQLAALIDGRGTDREAIGDLVHDVASQQASGVNNESAESQARYLVEHLGEDGARAALADLTTAGKCRREGCDNSANGGDCGECADTAEAMEAAGRTDTDGLSRAELIAELSRFR